MIEARNKRKRFRAREAAVGRLEAENSAERGRHADRAVGVGAQRDRREPARDRAARAARRAAAHVREIVRISRGAVVRVLAGEIVGVFAHVERADEDRAGRFETRDERRVRACGRALAVDLRSRARRQARDVEEVLDRERRARERAELFAARAGGVDLLGLLKRARRRHVGEGAELGVERLDALKRRLDDFAARSPRRSRRPRGFRARFSNAAAGSCRIDRRRLRLVVEREVAHQAGQPLGGFEMHFHHGARVRRQLEAEQRQRGVDQGVGVEFSFVMSAPRRAWRAASSSRRSRPGRGSSPKSPP